MVNRTRGWTLLWTGVLTLCCGSLFGQERWVYRHNGPADGSDGARSIAYGSDGHIYAAGYTRATSSDFTIISLTDAGDTNWVYAYNGPVDATDDAYSISCGSDGNIYAAGGSYLTVGRATDFTVISLASSGMERWVYQYDGGAGALDRAYSVAYGVDGNIYVAGNCWAGGGNYWDFTIVSLPPSGPPANWVHKYDGPGSEIDNSDAAYSVVCGSDGNIYAAGKSYGSGTWRDFTVVSVTASGGQRWVYRYNGSANLDDIAQCVIYGGDGNVYVAGYVRNANKDFVVVSLPSTGPPANWVYTYNGPGNGDDAASAIVYGSDGNIYAAGYSTGNTTYEDFTVISLTGSGTERWVYTHNGPAGSTDGAASIVYNSDDNVYAAGGRTDSLTNYDFVVISLDTAGAERWVYSYDGPANGDDGASSMVMGVDGTLYAAGYSSGGATGEDFTVISLRRDVGVQQKPEARSKTPEARLGQNFPNPFSHTTTITYHLTRRHGDAGMGRLGSRIQDQGSQITLAVYDLSGRLVRTLLDQPSSHPTIQLSQEVVWDGRDEEGRRVSTGVYFYRLTAGRFSDTKRMVLMR